jgi:hypothetical protein
MGCASTHSKHPAVKTNNSTQTTISLIFLLHLLARLGHNQGEHVKHEVEITEILQ